jgi:amino acid transporter
MMASQPGDVSTPVAGDHFVADTSLKAGAIKLPGILMQGVTTIAPAIAGLFTIPFIASNAGVAAPLAYAGAFVIALMLGIVLAQLARHMTSAGTYYTYVSRTLGGKAGFLVAWVYLLFYPVVVAQVGSFMGDVLHSTLKSEYGWNFPWWAFMAFLIVFVAVCAYRGIELSVSVLVVLGIFEIVVCLALGLWGLFDPGKGGVSLDWVNPGNAPSTHGFFLGVVFAIFAISGWDASAPLAEESEDPRRNIPRGVIGSILILGVFLVIVSWGQLSGWGTNDITGFTGSSELPAFVLGHQYWSGAWILVLIALLNSALAVAIATTNAATRIYFGMARSGALPAQLTRVHPRFRTPTVAIAFQTVVNIALGIVLPILIGVANVYNLTGTWFTFALIPVYIMANIGVFLLYRREHRDEFNPLYHVVFPVLSSIALIVVGYESLNPLPAWPIKLAAPIVLIWLALGIAVLAAMLSSGREAWLARAGDAIAELPEPAEARAHRNPLV